MRFSQVSLIALIAASIASSAHAAETLTYTYDAKGRLTKVVRTGSVNNNVQAQYTHDKANNRTTITVTGSPNPPP
jgi:YD repeat-containing protein